jgi:hypothetical protein
LAFLLLCIKKVANSKAVIYFTNGIKNYWGRAVINALLVVMDYGLAK